MLPLLAWIAALSVTAEEPAPLPTDPSVPTEPAPPASVANYLVRIDLGPELARRMGVRVVVRPTGDNFGNRRSAVALELPRPVSADLPPNAASIRLPAGVWRIEASAPGFLPSTREFTVDATTPDQTLAWPLLPSSSHSDISFPITATNSPSVAIRVRSANGDSWTCATQHTTCTLRLASGSFTVEARANGFQPVSQSFVVAAGPPVSVPITLVAAGTPALPQAPGQNQPVPTDMRRRLALGLGLSATPLLAAGVGLAVAGRLQYIGVLRGSSCSGVYGPVCANAIVGPIHRTSAGFGMLGAAVGLAATSITAAFPVSRTTWGIELAIGGALTAAGAAWTITNTTSLDRALQGGPIGELDARARGRLGASLVLGLGTGATVGALTGFLLHRRSTRLAGAFSPYAAAGQGGLLWAGHF
jgi:hypothetical protein